MRENTSECIQSIAVLSNLWSGGYDGYYIGVRSNFMPSLEICTVGSLLAETGGKLTRTNAGFIQIFVLATPQKMALLLWALIRYGKRSRGHTALRLVWLNI